MITIASATTLAHVLNSGCDPALTLILQRYREMLSDQPLAQLFIVQPGDKEGLLELLRGRPFEHWEFILAEPGWFEAVFVLSDYGEGHVVLVPDRNTTDAALLAVCRHHALADD